MTATQQQLEPAKVVGPDEAESYWQPVPANGFIRNIFSQTSVGSRGNVSIGTQTLPAGCFIREHTHAKQEEIIYVVEGRGIARIDGVEQPLETGSAVFVGMNRKHHFLNPHDEPMTFVWVMTPGGLDRYFAEIGRPRRPGEPAPEPFPRPANVAEIEARTVFGWADQSYNQKA
jgi:quercetin dioxygenase-like cupin family protein